MLLVLLLVLDCNCVLCCCAANTLRVEVLENRMKLADAGSGEADGRRLTLVLSTLALFAHSLSAILLHHLPADPLNLASNFALYSVYAAVLSALGLAGAVKRSPTLVTIFTHHLLIDAILSTIPRVLLIPAIASIPGTLCAEVEYQRSQLSPRDARALFGFWTADRCRAGLWAAQAVVALLALAMTAVQWWCAWRVRGYARWLEERDRREREGDVEKRGWGEGEEKEKGGMRSGEWI